MNYPQRIIHEAVGRVVCDDALRTKLLDALKEADEDAVVQAFKTAMQDAGYEMTSDQLDHLKSNMASIQQFVVGLESLRVIPWI